MKMFIKETDIVSPVLSSDGFLGYKHKQQKGSDNYLSPSKKKLKKEFEDILKLECLKYL